MATPVLLPSHHHPRLWTQLEKKFELLGKSTQFVLLVGGVFLFFGIHNLLQETMMSFEGFRFGIMLGYMEVLGVAVCSFVERTYIAQETGRVAPLSHYPLLTFCLMSSSALSNLALNFINFPTKVVFRSCKLIPTMIVASIVHRKIFPSIEYSCAVAICAGLVMFAAAEWESSPTFHPVGLTFVSLSVCADAILPNAQENLFRMGSSRLEVTFYTNIFTLMVMTLTTLVSGDLIGLLIFAKSVPLLQVYMVVYTFIAYIAISVHMTVVKRYGGVAAVLIATMRKAMTLVLSFLIFPKKFSWFYVVGATLVLSGITISSLYKMKNRNNPNKNATNGNNNYSNGNGTNGNGNGHNGNYMNGNTNGGVHHDAAFKQHQFKSKQSDNMDITMQQRHDSDEERANLLLHQRSPSK